MSFEEQRRRCARCGIRSEQPLQYVRVRIDEQEGIFFPKLMAVEELHLCSSCRYRLYSHVRDFVIFEFVRGDVVEDVGRVKD